MLSALLGLFIIVLSAIITVGMVFLYRCKVSLPTSISQFLEEEHWISTSLHVETPGQFLCALRFEGRRVYTFRSGAYLLYPSALGSRNSSIFWFIYLFLLYTWMFWELVSFVEDDAQLKKCLLTASSGDDCSEFQQCQMS